MNELMWMGGSMISRGHLKGAREPTAADVCGYRLSDGRSLIMQARQELSQESNKVEYIEAGSI